MIKLPTTLLRSALCLLMLLLLPVHGIQTNKTTRKTASPTHLGIENARALDGFFRALRAVKFGRRLEPVRIMHFGDSHVAADVLTREIRERFQADFGDGGPGFLIPTNPMATRRRGVVAGATSGWVIEGIGGRAALDRIYGPAGISLTTTASGERTWVETRSNHFEVYFVRQTGGGVIDIGVDGASVLDEPIALSSRVTRVDHISFDTPADAVHRLEVRTIGTGKVRVLGIVAERISPGVSYDVFGINGARASRILSWNQPAFSAAIKARNPDLIILTYGTNEIADRDWTPLSYQLLLGDVLQRLHAASPGASLLVFAPPDRADLPLFGRMATLSNVERSTALENGAAFWSAYDTMGGEGSMSMWVSRGLAQPDRVHLTTVGYARLADRFYEDVKAAMAK